MDATTDLPKTEDDGNEGPGTSASSRADEPGAVLPLAKSLETTLALLLRRTGHLMAQQAQLHFQQSQQQAGNEKLDIQSLPGWRALLQAASRWQRDVKALGRWVNEAQEALIAEHAKAKKREREAALAAEEERKKAAAEAQEAAKAAAASEPSKDSGSGGTAPADIREDGREGVIDLTEDDDDDNKTLSGNAAKRTREGNNAEGGENSADGIEGESKKPKLEAQSQQLGDTSTLSEKAEGAGDEASAPTTTDETMRQPLDLSTMGMPDLSGVDFSAFMNMSGGGGGDTTASLSAPDFGAFNLDGSAGNGAQITGGGGNGDSLDADNLMAAMSDANFSGQDDFSGINLEGMDFPTALQGVDWSSLLQGFHGGGGGADEAGQSKS